MSFEQLWQVSRLSRPFIPHELADGWKVKREHLTIYQRDIPVLVGEYLKPNGKPYDLNPNIILVDPVPGIRLASACEATCNCLYGMAEISAQVGNRASKNLLPSSFNAIRKKAKKGELSQTRLGEWIADFEWYERVRELRTEWAHHSTVFLAPGIGGDPVLVVRCHRRQSDREKFHEQVEVRVSELLAWIGRAVATIDTFGDHLLVDYILPQFDLNETFESPKLDENGVPVIRPDYLFETERVSVADYFKSCGIQ